MEKVFESWAERPASQGGPTWRFVGIRCCVGRERGLVCAICEESVAPTGLERRVPLAGGSGEKAPAFARKDAATAGSPDNLGNVDAGDALDDAAD